LSYTKKISQLGTVTRFKDWRLSFVPVVIGVVYFWLYWFEIKLDRYSAVLFVLSLLTTIGFACFGYFINEFFDKSSDQKAGKINKLSLISPGFQLSIFLGSLAIMLTPWFWLPSDRITWVLIGTEILLFLLYSLPFPRLKRFAFISGIIDSAYAYVIPMILSCYTYQLFSQKQIPDFFLLMTLGFFIIGYRNILIHQVNDIFKDMRAGIVTLPQKLGTIKTSWIILVLLISELGILISFLSITAFTSQLILLCLAGYFVFLTYRIIRLRNIKSIRFISIHPIRHLTDPFLQFWFPWIILGILISFHWHWIILIPIQIMLIISKSLIQKVAQQLRWCRRMLSLFVNYSIYYFFKIFGVDLIKENKSAVGYLRNKMGKK
jgi:4-hydroxybenzoate polyprenyltransferase